MKHSITFAFLLLSSSALAMDALQAYEIFKQRADKAYEQERYKTAFMMYNSLSEVGDKFSQYRMAKMYEHGLYVEQNLITAYAWSYVSAELGNEILMEYHEQIKKRLAPEQLEPARLKASELLQKYGLFANAVKTMKMIKDVLRTCRTRCSRIAPGDIGGGCNGQLTLGLRSTISCLRTGTLGLKSVVGNPPAMMRDVRESLNIVIDTYNPGRVELGDFELIDDDPQYKQKDTNKYSEENKQQGGENIDADLSDDSFEVDDKLLGFRLDVFIMALSLNALTLRA